MTKEGLVAEQVQSRPRFVELEEATAGLDSQVHVVKAGDLDVGCVTAHNP